MALHARNVFAALAVLLASARAVDITAEMNSGWMMGLRPRQATQNLQTFAGTLGGVGASAVCFDPRRQKLRAPYETDLAWLDYQLRGPRAAVCR